MSLTSRISVSTPCGDLGKKLNTEVLRVWQFGFIFYQPISQYVNVFFISISVYLSLKLNPLSPCLPATLAYQHKPMRLVSTGLRKVILQLDSTVAKCALKYEVLIFSSSAYTLWQTTRATLPFTHTYTWTYTHTHMRTGPARSFSYNAKNRHRTKSFTDLHCSS